MNPTLATFNPRPVTLPGDLASLCRQHLSHLTLRGRSANTIMAYRRDLEQFVGYLAALDITLVQLVRTQHVEGFIDALLAGEGNSRRTAARKLQAVNGLFRFVVSRGVMPATANPCSDVTPVTFTSEKPLSPEGSSLMALIATIPTDSPLGLRDRALFRLMYDTALRVGGVCSLDLHDANDPPRWGVRPSGVVHYRAKGGATGETVVSEDETLADVAAWLEVRHRFEKKDGPQALFLSERGTRMNRASIHVRIKYWGTLAGMPHMHCHLFRHRRAADALEHGDIYQANYLLGHKRMSTTTDMYGAQSREKIRARIRREIPLGGKKEVA